MPGPDNINASRRDIIRIENEYYIRASSSLADDRTHVLKDGEAFAIFDRYGDMQPVGTGEQGFYFEGTRYLNRLEFRFDVGRPELLHSAVRKDNVVFTVDLANPDIYRGDVLLFKRETIHVARLALVRGNTCYQRFRIKNYSTKAAEITFSLIFDTDYKDIFEIRGMKRKKNGQTLPPQVNGDRVVLSYQGLDGVKRRTHLSFSPKPHKLTHGEAQFRAKIKSLEELPFLFTVSAQSDESAPDVESYRDARSKAKDELKESKSRMCDIFTSNEQFNDWLNTSFLDLHMMLTRLETGAYPYAGVPWFSTAFGRDGIITALELLWVNPGIARGTLAFLERTQAKENIPAQDGEPGKIIHETRKGEMASLGEVPFGKYYGSVDATPLYLLLAGAYYERTGDLEFIRQLWPSIELALGWIERHGDHDGDGFIEYARRSEKGLVQQGWKDSSDSVFHSDGSVAKGPIALCEVQGYVYAAYEAVSRLAAHLGKEKKSRGYRKKADSLKEKFQKVFWCEDIGMYALALDGQKNPCKVKTSNAGHCLFTGIASDAHAQIMVDTLFNKDLFSGWGIRTLGASEARYNPMSYHNGSIWPHDNALIASGLARYGYRKEALKLLRGFLDASLLIKLHRMPELFCGFPRREGEGPTPYPVACAPQSWAAASVFLFLQAVIGLSINVTEHQVQFSHPILSEFLTSVRIRRLKVDTSEVDLSVEFQNQHTGVKILKKDDSVQVVTKR